MRIKNINGTSEREPSGYKSWQDFWEKKTGLKAENDVGGHVKKVDSQDNTWHIADITYAQNNLSEPYDYNSELAKLYDYAPEDIKYVKGVDGFYKPEM